MSKDADWVEVDTFVPHEEHLEFQTGPKIPMSPKLSNSCSRTEFDDMQVNYPDETHAELLPICKVLCKVKPHYISDSPFNECPKTEVGWGETLAAWMTYVFGAFVVFSAVKGRNAVI
jgi:hypothetical protein